MARHVHIYLHGRTADAFEESKHPRDGGKFASKPGAGKSDYARARESEHDDRRDADYAKRRAEAKAKADADAAKKKPAKEPKPKAEPKPAAAPKAPAKTQEQKDAEGRVRKRQAASAAAARGDTALAKQLLSEIRKVDQEVEREERKR